MSSRADVITVVEDDVAMARAVDRLLRARGFNVEIFYSAETFLASPSATVARCLVVARGEYRIRRDFRGRRRWRVRAV